MVKMMLGIMVVVLVVIPMFVSCAPNAQTPPPIAVDNQTVKPQTPTVDNSKIIKTKPEEITASDAKGFVYESFAGITKIYYMKANGQDKIKLGQSGSSQPVWSPDGKTIAFVSGDGIICAMDIEGENVKEFTAGRNPVWSPDSTKIAYILDGERKSPGGKWNYFYRDSLYVINADGTGLKEIAKFHMMFSPMWSPDGMKLVIVGSALGDKISESDTFGNADIQIVNADGTEITNITNTADASEKAPCWSPDGQHIAFLSNDRIESGSAADYWNLYVMRNDGTEVRKLNGDTTVWAGYAGQSRNYQGGIIGSGSMESPQDRMSEMYGPFTTWSPNGKYITICTVRAQGPTSASSGGANITYCTISMPAGQFPVGSLIIFDIQTGKETTAVASGKRSVCWSSDSKRICYIPPSGSQGTDQLVGYRKIQSRNLIIMDPDGSNPQTIYDCYPDGYLNWRP